MPESGALVSTLVLCGTFNVAWAMPVYWIRYPYDITSILFFIGLAFAARTGRFWLWYGLLLIGAINRETVVFVLPYLAALLWMQNRRKAVVVHLALSLLVVFAVKGLMIRLFHGLPFEFKLLDNLGLLAGAKGIRPFWRLLLTYVGIWLLIPFGYRSLPVEYRAGFWTAGCGIAFIFVFGNLEETRVWIEYAVFIIPAGVWGLMKLVEKFKGQAQPKPVTES